MSVDLHDSCGVIAFINTTELGNQLYLGLHALQHRGQESSGFFVLGRAKKHLLLRKQGHVVSTYTADEIQTLNDFDAHNGLGHVLYSTSGSKDTLKNIQPIVFSVKNQIFAIAHNGEFTNTHEIKALLEQLNPKIEYQTDSDSELFGQLVCCFYQDNFLTAIKTALSHLHGAYCLVMLTEESLYAIRDPYGWHPLVMGQKNKSICIASETVALDINNYQFIQEITPGQILQIKADGAIYTEQFSPAKPHFCTMELAYFMRPDHQLFGSSVHQFRQQLGQQLFHEHPIQADIVIGVPDSSLSLALGYSQASGIPFEMGLIKNHYVARSFIANQQAKRAKIIQMKLNVNHSVIHNKRIILVDDSIVRGTTMRNIISIIQAAQPKSLHILIGTPPLINLCYYGIDLKNKAELIMSNENISKRKTFFQHDDLRFLSLDGLKKVFMQFSKKPLPEICHACFSNSYPEVVKDAQL